MSGQQMFQIVSAGKTLRATPPAQVLQEAVSAFSISAQQARRLLLKGWVIKDQLSSKQVLEYQARLQKIGLKIEVHPAGKFDNRALLARLQFAEKRRTRREDAAQVGAAHAELKPAAGNPPPAVKSSKLSRPKARNVGKPAARAPQVNKPETAGKSRAEEQLTALFGDGPAAIAGTTGERLQLLAGVIAAALVPGLFVLLALFCVYSAALALWNIPAAVLNGDLGTSTLLGSGIALLLIALVALLLPWHYFRAHTYRAQIEERTLPLVRDQAPGMFLLLKVLARKTGLPQPNQIEIHAGTTVVGEAVSFRGLFNRELRLKLGLGTLRSLEGGEVLALIARALAGFSGRLCAIASWLVLDTDRRLQWLQWALENERSLLARDGEPAKLLRPLHLLLVFCSRPLLPLFDKLGNLHRGLTATVARRLERIGDARAAQIIGSEGFVRFAERWHQLVHADLVVGEVNREAALVGQRLTDYPAAVAWQLRNLDGDTRSNIELAMAQPSDSWDSAQPADNERVHWAEELGLEPLLLQGDFSAQKLFADFPALCAEVSGLTAADDCRAVDNQQLLTTSKEAEQAQQLLSDFFNRSQPRRFLPLQLPKNEELRAMDLQASIDWLRGKLVDLQELQRRCEQLQLRGASIQLGAALVRAQSKIDPKQYFLSGITPAAADESIRDNRARVDELDKQCAQIFSIFFLRITRAIEAMPASERASTDACLEHLAAYDSLRGSVAKLDQYGDLFGLMIDSLALDKGQRELVQKYLNMAAQELRSLEQAMQQSAALRERKLPEALVSRSGNGGLPELPSNRQGIVDLLQMMELRCKNASAVVCEHYRIQLAQLLQLCLNHEHALKVRPLRLVSSL